MIAKTKANSSFRGTTRYVIEKEKAQIIGGNMIGLDTNTLVAEFKISSYLNPKVQAPCYHLMLSLPHRETLSNDQFARLGERHFATVVVLSELTGEKAKLTNPSKRIGEKELNELVDQFLNDKIHQYSFFIARHHDREHNHIHIVASRINEITTHAIKTWMQYPQSEWSARLLEKRFGLEQVPCSWESKNKALTRTQLDRLEKDGLPAAEKMRRAIDEVAQNQPTLPQFIEQLAPLGVLAQVCYHANGQVRGIKYSIQLNQKNIDNQNQWLTLAGNQLSRHKYSLPKLQSELGISYIPERDDGILKALALQGQKLVTEVQTNKKTLSVTASFQESLPSFDEESQTPDETVESVPISTLQQQRENILLLQTSEEIIDKEEEDERSITALPVSSNAQNSLLQLTDAQLLATVKQLEQWQKNSPRQPSLNRGETLKQRLDQLTQQKAKIEKQQRTLKQELLDLGPTRSLFHPRGVSAFEIERRQRELERLQHEIDEKELERKQAEADFKSWQKIAKAYLAWQEEPQTQAMNQLAEDLKLPLISARLAQIKQGYAIYDSAQYILKGQGEIGEEGRYFEGRIYRIEERKNILSISRYDCDKPLFVAKDNRKAGGIVEVSQFNLTIEDQEIILCYAKSLLKQHEQVNQTKNQLQR
ncbi:relaxase/mobilization nuclease domain-containing protein [Chroococcus sp. FPU101]|uniref:relaxase/mobilization nuclease domain-containing protein n=1 Tax=Chroococcus sp. FPU101 TaxID=1974212 RepID=UPI001A8CA547|nr:relaxase/mobilization nuclease domain-containing protein [Chroococcus sp. FPU101]GFE71679.1 relaxase/mobilization nuclease family protein [Chroococcus sp. FPU101]